MRFTKAEKQIESMSTPHRPPILKPEETYTFGRYFDLRFAPADILRELGATLSKRN